MRRLTIACFVIAAAGLAGCGSSGGSNSSSGQAGGPAAAAAMAVQNAPSRNAVMVRRGPAPISYMVGPAGRIYVRATKADKILAETQVPARTAVNIDAVKGIAAGGRNLVAGPLPAGEQYELWLDTTRKD